MSKLNRGLSGPAILQISSYWNPGDIVEVDLLPNENIQNIITQALSEQPNVSIKNLLSKHFAKRFVEKLMDLFEIPNLPIKQLNHKQVQSIADNIHSWKIKPSGTEGYRTAEVTIGGLNTNNLSSKTMEVKSVSGLYFIGEAIDVTGWLGGYNFQWAWSSGWVAGQNA